MNTHDIDVEQPPLPRGDIAADTCPTMWVHTDQQLQDYARAAIEADRKRRGEPVAYLRAENLVRLAQPHVAGCAASIKKEPADGFIPIFTAPQPAEPDEERLAMEAVMESVDPATWPGLTPAQRCALGRFAKPQSAEPVKGQTGKTVLQSQDREEGYRAMAAEYQRWIDAYHQGMDYEDFMKKEARLIEGEGE